MYISFITSEYPHPKIGLSGGIGTSIFTLANLLTKSGIHVNVVVYGMKRDDSFVDCGINFFLVKNVVVKGLSYFYTVKKVQKLITLLIEKQECDFVEVPDWTGFSAFLNVDVPVVMRLNGSDSYFCHLEGRKVKFFNRYLERRAFKRADSIISVSEFTGKTTNNIFGFNRKFVIIPNPVDVSKYSNFHFDDITPGKILYFGTLIRKKGLFELPYIFNEVVKNFPNANLDLIGKDSFDIQTGNPSTWDLIRPLFTPLALERVNYLGPVEYSKIQDYIDKACVCVFPSFAEAMPVSWLEAMAMSKAVVASDVGWAPEVIDDEIDGFLVNPKDHIKYASRIVSVLNDQNMRRLISLNARRKVESTFAEKNALVTYINHYSSL
ncbi:glycosyltransferase family 4 protein [Algoriphagus sp. D3-2-R+10]|uniref:glycosyltransferase family 4 protein n=1 Tax=Algoriphagus aurantiacus TaxID=3103948 RepID=UPI002B386830|nr:glycosyltransferase family 4 protein [Algoriphagus sp. D3-2-R+10]MEB2777519.1 glycosyltransferase family 4 protein [Algoriphagus sp. D3-2-R+10]